MTNFPAPRNRPNPYLETRIRTASALELTAIMYDVLVESLNRAVAATQAKAVEQRTKATNRAMAALVELRCALDHKQGGELAASLDRLYAYGLAQLTTAVVEGDAKKLESLSRLFSPMREAWHEAAQNPAGQSLDATATEVSIEAGALVGAAP